MRLTTSPGSEFQEKGTLSTQSYILTSSILERDTSSQLWILTRWNLKFGVRSNPPLLGMSTRTVRLIRGEKFIGPDIELWTLLLTVSIGQTSPLSGNCCEVNLLTQQIPKKSRNDEVSTSGFKVTRGLIRRLKFRAAVCRCGPLRVEFLCRENDSALKLFGAFPRSTVVRNPFGLP